MDLEKLIKKMICENPINIHIKYSNINGREQLTVNGKELSFEEDEKFKNEYLLEQISYFKKNLDELPDGLFNKMLEIVKENVDLQKFDDLLNQTKFTNEEIDYVKSHMKYINNTIKDIIQSKIDKLSDLLNKFSE